MILIIDSYDSFVYNLYQCLGELEPDLRVVRNDALTVSEIRALAPAGIVLSPGPGRPEEAGVIMAVVRELGASTPILGVCLGHQAICAAFGARVDYAARLMHGKASRVKFSLESKLFTGLAPESAVARYHSLAAVAETMPASLRVTAKTLEGEIMAVEHVTQHIYGVQFHPESILTDEGMKMLGNFVAITRSNDARSTLEK